MSVRWRACSTCIAFLLFSAGNLGVCLCDGFQVVRTDCIRAGSCLAKRSQLNVSYGAEIHSMYGGI
jgi:hypothetical protein